MVARDSDVDYAAGGDVVGEEDGWEFDLSPSVAVSVCHHVPSACATVVVQAREPTSRLSSVKSTATPASTLPTVKETNMMGRSNQEDVK